MREIIPAARDIMFKMLFSRDKELLKGFLNEAVGLQINSADDIIILNPELTPEHISGKFARLDINTVTAGIKVKIEMQSYSDENYIKRDLFYWAKMYTGDLRKGEDYEKLVRSISISVMNFRLFDCAEYYSEYCIMEKSRHTPLTDLLSMNFFELPKIGGISESSDKTDNRLLWLQLIKAEREEELNMLQNTTNAMIQKGAQTIFELSEDEKLREAIRLEDARLHEETSRINSAIRKGIAQGMAQGIAQGMAQGIAQGMAQGIAQGEAKGIAKGITQGRDKERERIAVSMRAMGIPEEQINAVIYGSESI